MKDLEIELYPFTVESGVPEQPIGEETYQGALNRVNSIRKFLDADYYISCEAGIESAFNQYFNVQVVCIYETKTQSFLWGKSAGWAIPAEDIEVVRQNNLDTYMKSKGLNCLEDLLGKGNSRRAAVAQATEFALASGRIRND